MRSIAAAATALLIGPGCLLGQDRLMPHEAVFAVDGEPVASVQDVDLVNCIWMATYNFTNGLVTDRSVDPLAADSAVLRISFYIQGEPASGPLEARDGSDARFHTAVLGSVPLLMMSRKEFGYSGPYSRPKIMADWGELILATLGLPTRREDGAPTVRQFSVGEVRALHDLHSDIPPAAHCPGAAEEGALTWRSPA